MNARTAKLKSTGTKTLAGMRASNDDPAKSPEARARQREKARRESLAMRAWEREHGRTHNQEHYEAEILPLIKQMTVPALVSATGLSKYYCWQVRAGARRLHARHWEAILAASQEAPTSVGDS